MTLFCQTLLGTGTEIFFQLEPPGCVDTPQYYTVTVGVGGASLAATTVPVTALPVFIQEGTTLNFGAVDAILTADAAQGATSITVKPLAGALVAGQTTVTLALLRLFGAESHNWSTNDSIIDTSSYDTGIYSQSGVVGKDIKFSVSGHFKVGDPCYKSIIMPVVLPTSLKPTEQRVYCEIYLQDRSYYKFMARIENFQQTVPMKDKITVSFDLHVQGKMLSYALFPSP